MGEQSQGEVARDGAFRLIEMKKLVKRYTKCCDNYLPVSEP